MYHYLDEAFLADHRQTEVSILFVNFADYCSAGSRRCNLRCTEIPRYFGMSQAVYLSFFLRNILYSNCAHPLIERSLLMFSAQYFAHTAHISSTSISSIPAPIFAMADKYIEDGSKPQGEVYHLEDIDTTSHVPGNPIYLEIDGLRTEGDGMDHTHYNSVSHPSQFFPSHRA